MFKVKIGHCQRVLQKARYANNTLTNARGGTNFMIADTSASPSHSIMFYSNKSNKYLRTIKQVHLITRYHLAFGLFIVKFPGRGELNACREISSMENLFINPIGNFTNQYNQCRLQDN